MAGANEVNDVVKLHPLEGGIRAFHDALAARSFFIAPAATPEELSCNDQIQTTLKLGILLMDFSAGLAKMCSASPPGSP